MARLKEISLRLSQGVREECKEVVIPSIPHQLTIIQAAIKDNRPKLPTTDQKLGLKMTMLLLSLRKSKQDYKEYWERN